MPRAALTVAEVFRRYGDAFRAEVGAALSTAQRRVMTAIEMDGPPTRPTPAAERAAAVRSAADALDRAADAMNSYGTRALLKGMTGVAGAEGAFRTAENLRSCAASQRRGMDAHCHFSLDLAVPMARGGSAAARRSRSRCPTPSSPASAAHPSPQAIPLDSGRTAVYGPVRTVVWDGRKPRGSPLSRLPLRPFR